MIKKETLNNNLNSSRVYMTVKQKQVLEYLAKGLKNKEIAVKMELSVPTVKLHISKIFLRLEVHTRTAAVVKAQKLGLI